MSIVKEFCKNYKKLDIDTEKSLITRAQNGDVKARNELINSITPGIARMAIEFSKLTTKMELGDFLSEGYMGACKAVEMYNLESGVKFNTFALSTKRNWVYNTMSNALSNSNLIPGSTDQKKGKAEKYSFASTDNTDAEFNLGEVLQYDTQENYLTDEMTIRNLLEEFNDILTDKERLVVELASEGDSFREIGDKISKSHEQARNYCNSAMKKLSKRVRVNTRAYACAGSTI